MTEAGRIRDGFSFIYKCILFIFGLARGLYLRPHEMKKALIKIGILFIAIIGIVIMLAQINRLGKENTRLKSNQEILLSENEVLMTESRKYKVSDSLNAAKVTALQMTVKEFEKLRVQDLETIRLLKINKKDLEALVASQTETILDLKAQARDTIITDTTGHTDTLKAFSYMSKWTDVYGTLSLITNEVNLKIANRESLTIVESVEYKRFLGFLWRTRKVKSREVDVLSANPATTITHISYTRIGK